MLTYTFPLNCFVRFSGTRWLTMSNSLVARTMDSSGPNEASILSVCGKCHDSTGRSWDGRYPYGVGEVVYG